MLMLRWQTSPKVAGVLVMGWGLVAAVGTILQLHAHPLSGWEAGLMVWPALVVYGGLAMLLNRTEVEVRKESLRIRAGPVPTFGNAAYAAAQFSQLYVFEKESTYKGKTTISYELRARLKTGKHVTLVAKLASPALALYLEQAIEKRFEIKDTPVVNELDR